MSKPTDALIKKLVSCEPNKPSKRRPPAGRGGGVFEIWRGNGILREETHERDRPLSAWCGTVGGTVILKGDRFQ